MNFKAPAKQIFVAYGYGVYNTRDYRRVYSRIESAFNVNCVFADEMLAKGHIFGKITRQIQSSKLSVFDMSGGSQNVAIELGFAMRNSNKNVICFNPDKSPENDVPSDIRGLDRIQYRNYDELYTGLFIEIDKRFKSVRRQPIGVSRLDQLPNEIPSFLGQYPGARLNEIAVLLRFPERLIRDAIEPLLDWKVKAVGHGTQTRYFEIDNYD